LTGKDEYFKFSPFFPGVSVSYGVELISTRYILQHIIWHEDSSTSNNTWASVRAHTTFLDWYIHWNTWNLLNKIYYYVDASQSQLQLIYAMMISVTMTLFLLSQ